MYAYSRLDFSAVRNGFQKLATALRYSQSIRKHFRSLYAIVLYVARARIR